MNTIDQLGHMATYNYDILNRKTSTIDALGGIVTLNYDANNNLLNLTDPVCAGPNSDRIRSRINAVWISRCRSAGLPNC